MFTFMYIIRLSIYHVRIIFQLKCNHLKPVQHVLISERFLKLINDEKNIVTILLQFNHLTTDDD